jgi:predicted methyltransferase
MKIKISSLFLLFSMLLLMPTWAWSVPVEQAMAKAGRLAADLERDLRSMPQSIIPLLNLEEGDRVVDIFGSGGYYSELLAGVVGTTGEVILHNNEGFKAWGINILNDRFEGRSPGNITQLVSDIKDLKLGEDSLDGAIIVMALHDMYVIPKRYNGEEYVSVGPPADIDRFISQIYNALKPGGRFVVVDHAGDPDLPSETVFDLHRMAESFAKSEIERYGFRLVATSNALRNPNDDHTMIVFDLDIQGKTDRFVLAFEKP